MSYSPDAAYRRILPDALSDDAGERTQRLVVQELVRAVHADNLKTECLGEGLHLRQQEDLNPGPEQRVHNARTISRHTCMMGVVG